jgi:hypothetical protein
MLEIPHPANVNMRGCDMRPLSSQAVAGYLSASLTVSDWEGIKRAATSRGPQHQPTAISGVGDEALNLNGSEGSNLYVRKGDRGFLLTLNGPHIDHLADHGLEREKTLALKILPNL